MSYWPSLSNIFFTIYLFLCLYSLTMVFACPPFAFDLLKTIKFMDYFLHVNPYLPIMKGSLWKSKHACLVFAPTKLEIMFLWPYQTSLERAREQKFLSLLGQRGTVWNHKDKKEEGGEGGGDRKRRRRKKEKGKKKKHYSHRFLHQCLTAQSLNCVYSLRTHGLHFKLSSFTLSPGVCQKLCHWVSHHRLYLKTSSLKMSFTLSGYILL